MNEEPFLSSQKLSGRFRPILADSFAKESPDLFSLWLFRFADNLRLAVHDALCTNERRRRQYEEALIAITLDQSVER